MALSNASLKLFFQRYRSTQEAIISDRLGAWARTFGRIRDLREETAGVRFEEFTRRFDSFRSRFNTTYREYLEVLRTEAPDFNLFDLLGLSGDEDKHSRFIAALLNPRGSHGQGSLFLDRFLELLRERGVVFPDNLGRVKVRRERPTEDTKGRIDISIDMPGAESCCLILENKVWSRAHGLQLERYYLDGLSRCPKVILIYLTPYGRDPEKEAITPALRDELKRDGVLVTLSYRADIVTWLTATFEEIEAEHLRNSLRMYVNSLKRWKRGGG